jgi:hypothetical protein
MTRTRRLLAALLVMTTFSLTLPIDARAGLVGTEQAASNTDASRERFNQWLLRDDVRAALQARGIDAAAAQARIDALTDDEARQLAARIDQVPAGGDVLGAIVFIFIVLLITDILGFTKIFPFTRSIR